MSEVGRSVHRVSCGFQSVALTLMTNRKPKEGIPKPASEKATDNDLHKGSTCPLLFVFEVVVKLYNEVTKLCDYDRKYERMRPDESRQMVTCRFRQAESTRKIAPLNVHFCLYNLISQTVTASPLDSLT